MADDEEKPSYEVGYGKTPQHTRFKPGQSGNPRGKPKGAKNLATLVDKIINERVIVTENGKCKSISKLEAAIKQLVNRAASGDPKFLQQLLQLVQLVEWRTEAVADANTSVGEADQMVMQGILDRLRRSTTPLGYVQENDKETTYKNETVNDDDHNKT